ncbi:hypothetical protein [Methylobacterium sp. E-045]|uniref:hypothetical protein n=1 Tax=Methylobacterium sp. E-045 TaxID=2836575 RepID=UPI001FBB1657|nr:hypothetical protein [Methylobacterium sp. E-045]MCJ2129347.1 hypothetical protein [Methylobacterium sp. E-045]
MAKDKKSTFPGSIRENEEAVKAEAKKVSTKIEAAFGKFAKKMRERADTAKSKMNETRKPEKRAVLLKRYELYADAATHLEERLSHDKD